MKAAFLLSRQHKVNIGSSESDLASPNGSVPQGTLSGPKDFLVHINDMSTPCPMYKCHAMPYGQNNSILLNDIECEILHYTKTHHWYGSVVLFDTVQMGNHLFVFVFWSQTKAFCPHDLLCLMYHRSHRPSYVDNRGLITRCHSKKLLKIRKPNSDKYIR